MPVLADSPWLGAALWAALHVSDFAFTLACARMYHAGVRDVLVFEGSFELTPFFQKDVDALRTISPRFALSVLWGVALLIAAWWASRLVWPEAYPFALGALVFQQVAVHVRHIRNFVLFRKILGRQGIRGRVEYARPAMLQISATELACFAGVFLVASLVAFSPVFLGGAAGCASLALQHLRLARKHET
jgi:hypothetical protein